MQHKHLLGLPAPTRKQAFHTIVMCHQSVEPHRTLLLARKLAVAHWVALHYDSLHCMRTGGEHSRHPGQHALLQTCGGNLPQCEVDIPLGSMPARNCPQTFADTTDLLSVLFSKVSADNLKLSYRSFPGRTLYSTQLHRQTDYLVVATQVVAGFQRRHGCPFFKVLQKHYADTKKGSALMSPSICRHEKRQCLALP